MDADILIASQDDLSSQPDKTGRRWVTFQSLVNKPTDPMPGLGGGSKLRGMERDIEKMLWKIIKTHSAYPNQTPSEVEIAWTELGDERQNYKQILGLIIKDYLDGMEAFMKKNSRTLGKLLTDYTKKRIQDEDPDSGDKPMWDELIVNKIKIKMVHVSPEFGPDFEDDEDIDGFPFKLYDDVGSMTDYIDRKIQRIKL